jgi:hypothetical protein
MKTLLRGLIITVAMILGLAFAITARAEIACYQYSSWEAAQTAHQTAPWLGLDADGNGVACDCLLYGFPC